MVSADMSFLRSLAWRVLADARREAGATGNDILASNTTSSFHFLSKSIILSPINIAKPSPSPEPAA
jgi:hypothetical protein